MSSTLQSIWPVLAGLAYLQLVVMCKVLGTHWRREVGLHDRAVRARQLRRDYRDAVRQRQAQL
jgi:thiosulfate reductase cytochrome b subunit